MVTEYDRSIDSVQGRRMKQCGWVVVQVYGGRRVREWLENATGKTQTQ